MGIDALMPRAVFLDRDGVLNFNVLNPATGEMESPHEPKDLRLYPDTAKNLKQLRDAGYLLFVISNQPSYAKGKTSLENIRAIAEQLESELRAEGIEFTRTYYCLHHPKGVVEGYSGPCTCRKPSPFFLQEAARDFAVDLQASWMIGDRSTDIACGQSAGVRTVLVNSDSPGTETNCIPDFRVKDLAKAVGIILGI